MSWESATRRCIQENTILGNHPQNELPQTGPRRLADRPALDILINLTQAKPCEPVPRFVSLNNPAG